jgi:hypothetical protein
MARKTAQSYADKLALYEKLATIPYTQSTANVQLVDQTRLVGIAAT